MQRKHDKAKSVSLCGWDGGKSQQRGRESEDLRKAQEPHDGGGGY